MIHAKTPQQMLDDAQKLSEIFARSGNPYVQESAELFVTRLVDGVLISGLADHDGMKLFIENLKQWKDFAANELQNNEALIDNPKQSQFYHTSRAICDQLLSFFTNAEESVTAINQTIDQNLHHLEATRYA